MDTIKISQTEFSKYLSSDIYNHNNTIVKAKCPAIGIVKSKNEDDISLEVEWDKAYAPTEWYVYYGQDGVWKLGENKQKQVLNNALYELIFNDKDFDYKFWADNLDWSKKKLILDLFSKVKHEHVIKAIDEYIQMQKENRINTKREAVSYDLVYEDNNYPHKYILGIAHKIANNTLEVLDSSQYSATGSGKNSAKKVLENLGFTIVKREKEEDQVENNNLKHEITKVPLNQILYGPPGTGKTYHTNRLKENFVYNEDSVSDKEWLSVIIKDLTWFEVTVLALYDLNGRAKVPEIAKHDFIKAKAMKQNKERGIPQQIWAALQTHTVIESETVNYKNRVEPFVFDKTSDSGWLFVDRYEEIIPDVLDVYKKYKEEKPQSQELHNYEFITFHQSYGYEEFVEGIRAIPAGEQGNEDGSEMIYKVTDGIFKSIAKKAKANPIHKYAIFIDEINRGNISKIFGELITLIEESKRLGNKEAIEVTLPYSGEKFGVPSNLHIIGTMNTADRSIALMDTALRRRFEFVEMMPDYGVIREKVGNNGVVDGINIALLLEKINQRIEYLYDRDHTIGHAYFMGVADKPSLDSAMRNKVIPLLQEYFYDDWEKIQLVLNDGFIEKSTQDTSTLFDTIDDEYMEEDKYTYSIAQEFTEDSYRKIYGKIEENKVGE